MQKLNRGDLVIIKDNHAGIIYKVMSYTVSRGQIKEYKLLPFIDAMGREYNLGSNSYAYARGYGVRAQPYEIESLPELFRLVYDEQV